MSLAASGSTRRKYIAGWSSPELDEADWTLVKVVPPVPGQASVQMCPKNRLGTQFSAVTCTDLGKGLYELDFGAVVTGWLRMGLPPLPPGRQVAMHFADKRFQNPAGDDTPAGKIVPASQRVFDTARGPVCYQTYNQSSEFISAGAAERRSTATSSTSTCSVTSSSKVCRRNRCAGNAEARLVESDLELAGSFACSSRAPEPHLCHQCLVDAMPGSGGIRGRADPGAHSATVRPRC